MVAFSAMNKALLIVALFLVGTFAVAGQTKPEESSLTYGLVIDCSGSVKQSLKYIVASASSVVDSNTGSDQAFVTRFVSHEQIQTVQELTSDKTKLVKSIGALYFAAQYLDNHTHNARRALVLISDGEDRQSYYNLDTLLKYLRDKQIPVYILAFGNHSPRSLVFINKLAQDSGGKVVFAGTGKDLPSKAPDLIHLLREGTANPTAQPQR
jgi:Ca-activated chloride channel family protein